MSKQTIKEFLLDDKATSVLQGITKHEKEQFNELANRLINPPKKAETQKNPNRISIN